MSDSDDTDVLLLIPPDFFTVNSSDSEDSVTNQRRWFEGHGYITSKSCVEDLINHVQELEERLNVIESKDNLNSDEYLPDHGHFKRSFDCAVSVGSTKFRNLGHGDLALRFYSLSSDYRFGGESMDGVHYPNMHLQSAPVNVRRHLSLPSSPSPNLAPQHFAINHSNQLISHPQRRAIFMDPVSPHNVYEMSNVGTSNESCHVQNGVSHDNQEFGKGVQNYELQDVSFMGEIDEFLENRRKVLEQTDYKSLQPRDDSQSTTNIVTSHENIEQVPSSFGLHSFSNIPSSDSLIKPKAISPVQQHNRQDNSGGMDLPQVSKLLNEIQNTQKEIEYKLQVKETELDFRGLTYPGRGVTTSRSNINPFSEQNRNIHQLSSENRTTVTEPSFDAAVQAPLHVSADENSNQALPRATIDNKPVSGMNSKENRDADSIVEYSVSALKEGFESSCGVKRSFVVQNPNIQHSFVQYPSRPVKPHLSESGNNATRKQVSFESSTNLFQPISVQESVPLSYRNANLGFHNFEPDGKHFEYENISSHVSNIAASCTFVPLAQSLNSDNLQVGLPYSITDHAESQKNQYRSEPNQVSEKPSEKKKLDSVIQRDTANTQLEGARNGPEADDSSRINKKTFLPETAPGLPIGSSSSSTNLMSLSDLWSSDPRQVHTEHMTLEQRLEEERYRRQHCEEMIRQLQGRLLEEQQRLAVAVRVDRGKDKAILQLQEAWERLVSHWHELEEQRHYLAGQLSTARNVHQQEMGEMTQKVKRYEQELSKVLDLAQGYKDKCDVAEQSQHEAEELHVSEVRNLLTRIEEIENQQADAERHMKQILQDKEELEEKLKNAEEALHKEKQLLLKSRSEKKEVFSRLEDYEADIAALREENNSLHMRLKEERSRCKMLEQQKMLALESVEDGKKREKSLRDELRDKSELLEKLRQELRDYYQEQVEVVVCEKLQEFQTQLDNAEASLHREMEQRDKAAAEAAVKQVQHITEKHQLEVRLLEEKHREELQLYKLQLTQATQRISQLEVRLQSYSLRKSEIVEKLHGVMEAQWHEALRILSGGSPLGPVSSLQPRLQSGEKERGDFVLKSRPAHSHHQPSLDFSSASKSNTTAVETKQESFSKSGPAAPVEMPVRDMKSVPPLPVSRNSEGSSTADEMPFGQEGQLTYRVQMNEEPDIQKYIRMLLNKSPGFPMDTNTAADVESGSESERNLSLRWEKNQEKQEKLGAYYSSAMFDDSKRSQMSSKDNHSGKPPWK